MNIYAVYPDADATERYCNAIADSADQAVAMVRETGLLPMTDAAHAVQVDGSCLTNSIMPPVEEAVDLKSLLRRFLSYCALPDYANFGRLMHRVDAWSWRRARGKIQEAAMWHELDRAWDKLLRRQTFMRSKRIPIYLALDLEPVLFGIPSQYAGETEEPEEEA